MLTKSQTNHSNGTSPDDDSNDSDTSDIATDNGPANTNNTLLDKATYSPKAHPLSLANLLNAEPVLELTPEDIVEDIGQDGTPLTCDDPDQADSIADMCISGAESGIGDKSSSIGSGWETHSCDSRTAVSLSGISDDTSTHISTQIADVNKASASSSAKKTFLSYFRDVNEQAPSLRKKRSRSPLSDDTSSTMSSEGSMAGLKKKCAKKKQRAEQLFGPIGISRSATAARNARDAVKRGEFRINRAQEAKWRKKIKDIDSNAQFFDNNVIDATHFSCGRTIKAKEPYNFTHFRDHVYRCKGGHKKSNASGGTRSLLDMMSTGKWGAQKTQMKPSEPMVDVPCRGLSEVDYKLIPVYLKRTTVKGGGARSITKIALERFGKKFRMLTKDEKDVVVDVQLLDHQWRNDHANLRIFSTGCTRWIHKTETDSAAHCLKCH